MIWSGRQSATVVVEAAWPLGGCALDKMHLVLQANLDLLFWGRNDVILSCPLKSRKFLHSRFDDVKGLLNFLLGDDQRRRKADDVLVCGLGLESRLDIGKTNKTF